MELDYNVFSLFDLFALMQGIIFGTFLLLINKNKNKSTFFLGLLLILYSLELISHILWDLGVYDYYPELYALPFNFYWIIYPLFYIYTQKVSIFSNHKIKYWLLYPGIFSYAVQLFVFFQSYETKIDIFQNSWFNIFLVSGAFYSWVIAIWNLKLIKEHRSKVQNTFSRLEDKELQWTHTFIIFSIIGSFISILGYYQFDNNIYIKVFYTLFNLLVIYWLSYHGIVQRNILFLISKSNENPLAQSENPKVSESTPFKNEDAAKLMLQIDKYMTSSESFRETELTIVDLAKNLDIHTKRISTAINTVRKQNFNTYINNFRIEKAITLLREQDIALSIEGIGYEVGFHSKSAFYAAFKKVTGTTPTKFKEKSAA